MDVKKTIYILIVSCLIISIYSVSLITLLYAAGDSVNRAYRDANNALDCLNGNNHYYRDSNDKMDCRNYDNGDDDVSPHHHNSRNYYINKHSIHNSSNNNVKDGCISIYIPIPLGGGIANCLKINERTSILNSLNPTIMLKPLSGGWCSFEDYAVKDINSQNYCLESDK
jgi:hypothetical protein